MCLIKQPYPNIEPHDWELLLKLMAQDNLVTLHRLEGALVSHFLEETDPFLYHKDDLFLTELNHGSMHPL